MIIKDYDRNAAFAYAKRWAFARNPKYYNFDALGGDCTNFASQCVFAGAGVQNYTPTFGWFYKNLNDRTASWTGVEYFYNFLIGNGKSSESGEGIGSGAGPFAEEVTRNKIEVGDIIQLGRANGDFYHSPVVVGFSRGVPLIAAHTNDAFMRPINTYRYERIRYIHILGVRVEE